MQYACMAQAKSSFHQPNPSLQSSSFVVSEYMCTYIRIVYSTCSADDSGYSSFLLCDVDMFLPIEYTFSSFHPIPSYFIFYFIHQIKESTQKNRTSDRTHYSFKHYRASREFQMRFFLFSASSVLLCIMFYSLLRF